MSTLSMEMSDLQVLLCRKSLCIQHLTQLHLYLLSKTDKLNRTDVKVGGTGFSRTTKSVKDTSSSLDRMIERQKTLSSLLPYMDKSMANLASTFWMASKEVNSFNKYLDVLDNKKAILEQKEQAEDYAKAQAKATADAEKMLETGFQLKANYRRVELGILYKYYIGLFVIS